MQKTPAVNVNRVQEDEAFAGDVPRLPVGEVRRPHEFEDIDRIWLSRAMDERGPTGSMRIREDPQESFVIDLQRRVVVSVVGLLVEQDSRPRDLARLMVVIREHMQQPILALRPSAVTEEGFIRLLRINGDRDMLLRVCSQSAGILELVLVAGGLIRVPDAAEAVVRR